MRDELRQAAQAWGEEVLPGPRWRLERVSETARRHRGTGRACYRVRLRVWEPAGTARVRLEGAGPSVTFPFAPDEPAGHEPVAVDASPEGPRVVEAALAAGRAQWPEDRVAATHAARRPVRGGEEWLVHLERAQGDGVVLVDLDAGTGERLGVFAVPLLRGSRRSAALSRHAAVVRARDQAGGSLPPGARLARARLARGDGSRVWRIRWEGGAAGVAVTINARTGRLCAWERTLPIDARAAAFPDREEAAAELGLAVALRLGGGARTSIPVAGARAGRPVWFAVVQAPDGRLFRATLDRGRIDLVRRDAGAVARTA